MKHIKLVLAFLLVIQLSVGIGGNPDRSGQAGASELLINPFARSSGWAGANVANVRGLESQYLNIAGLAFTKKTELILARTNWLQGSGVFINSFGIAQRVGETGVLGLGVMSMSFGDIPITTVEQPDAQGEIGRFSPSYMNLSISYAKAFSNAIYGGFNLKIISQSIPDASAQGVALDAGIQYVTGMQEQIKFGISLKNVGPRMQFTGDGLSFRGFVPGAPEQMTVAQRSEEFELPSLLTIGGAYDIHIVPDVHRLTIAGNFTSNSFTKDQFMLGLEYGLKNYLMLRAGYMYENGITKIAERTTALTGPTAGLSIQIPLKKESTSNFSIDYSYRTSDPFLGSHSLGVRVDL
ncbi:MAG: PorV/PorQ family protein [Bacteroidales bacterium]|nr:PorV/PorQ family protein [Bacteroidales bacterium]